MFKHRVLIVDGLAKEGLALLKQNPHLELSDRSGIERKELLSILKDFDILIVRSRTLVDKELISNGHNLKLVLRAGIGLDNIDVDAATNRAIVVMNAPTGNIVTTAEHALAMLFAVSRHIPSADASLRDGKWEKSKFQGSELCGKTLGVLGLGNIGKAVAERAQSLKMKVVAFDPYLSEQRAAKLNIGLVPLENLLKTSDYISVHVPLNDKTAHMLGKPQFELMKPTAYLINCARGGIVDEQALCEALAKGQLKGAALDVFEQEPLPADSPLLSAPNLVMTPHLGASTTEAQTQVGFEVADQIIQYAEQGVLKNAVNVPNLSMEQLTVLRPHLSLCEKLGAFLGQVAAEQVSCLRIRYEGSLQTLPREILTLSVAKGFLTPLMSTTVNFVNVRRILKERGIRIEESFSEECADYQSLVEVTAEGTQKTSCSGTIFGKGEPRLVRIDGFDIEAVPTGCLLVSRNTDQPGVIGTLGTLIGQAGINIGRMHLGLDPGRGQAMALINVDSKVSSATLETLRKAPGMISVIQVEL